MRTVLVFGLVGTAWAGAKDKGQNTLIDRNATGILNNATAKTKVKSKGCKLQIQAATLGGALAPDASVVICIAGADLVGATTNGGNSVIIAGETKKGKLKIKAPLGEATLFGAGCGDTVADTFATDIKCYTDDPTFRSDGTGPGTWRDNCVAAGLIPGDSPSGAATMLKVNDTIPVMIGLCQGSADPPGTEGQRILPPASTEWAITGQRTQLE